MKDLLAYLIKFFFFVTSWYMAIAFAAFNLFITFRSETTENNKVFRCKTAGKLKFYHHVEILREYTGLVFKHALALQNLKKTYST